MPNSASSKKRLRQNHVLRLRNRSVKSAVRSQIKKVREAVASGDVGTAEEEFKSAAKKLDQASSRRILHPNASARYKSRLQTLIKKAKAAK